MIRVVFMGSPDFAVPSLRALQRQFQVVGVVTQPSRPAGRGRAVREPAIRREASALGLPIIQPERLTEPAAMGQLRDWAAELIVVAAFGQLLRIEILDLPAHGCVNVHASLLPRWRGAAPIQAAIAAGDAETGVTIMKMDKGMDTGAILSQRSIPIESQDTGATLSTKLSQIGAELLVGTLPAYLRGEITPRPQDPLAATKAPSLKKEDGLLEPRETADVLARRVRAFDPWPGTFVPWAGERLRILRAHVAAGRGTVGSRTQIDGWPALATAEGLLVLDEVQPAGKRPMSGRSFLMGAREWND